MYDKNRSGTVSPVAQAALTIGLSFIVPCIAGCEPVCSNESARMIVRGTVVDADTLEGLTRVNVDVWTLTQGEETGSGFVRIRLEDDDPSAGEPGAFEAIIGFREGRVRICPGVPPPTIPEFPRPDRVNVIIIQTLCGFEFTIDINEETVVDLDFPDDIIELIDPILVPECKDPDGSG